MTPRGARLTGLILAIALGYFLFQRARSAWNDYWLLIDARQGTATVTHEMWSGHDAVAYKYIVDQKEYAGHSSRDWKGKYTRVQAGEEAVVYFSASHPWLLSLYMPDSVVQGLPVILVVVAFEVFALITIVKPTSSWAFSLMEKNPKNEKGNS